MKKTYMKGFMEAHHFPAFRRQTKFSRISKRAGWVDQGKSLELR